RNGRLDCIAGCSQYLRRVDANVEQYAEATTPPHNTPYFPWVAEQRGFTYRADVGISDIDGTRAALEQCVHQVLRPRGVDLHTQRNPTHGLDPKSVRSTLFGEFLFQVMDACAPAQESG